MENLKRLSEMFAMVDRVLPQYAETVVGGLTVKAELIDATGKESLSSFTLVIRLSAEDVENQVEVKVYPEDSGNEKGFAADLIDIINDFAAFARGNIERGDD